MKQSQKRFITTKFVGSTNTHKGHNTQGIQTATKFLNQYCAEGNQFLKHSVTEDETWISYIIPETKHQLMQ